LLETLANIAWASRLRTCAIYQPFSKEAHMIATIRQRTREDPVVRRHQIVGEAMRVIGQHGYNGFTVQLLAVKCGLTNAGLLYYFGSKDALLIAVLDEVTRQDIEAMEPLVVAVRESAALTGDDLVKRVALLRTIVERFSKRRELGRFTVTLQTEALDPAHPAHAWFRERNDQAQQLFVDMVTGLVADPVMTGRLLYAVMNGLFQQWLQQDRGFDLLAAWDSGVQSLVLAAPGRHRLAKMEEVA
jgi:AcrR family transcriptional regulator